MIKLLNALQHLYFYMTYGNLTEVQYQIMHGPNK